MGVYLPYTKLPSEYQEVEYIQSSGTQRIDTGVVVTGTIGFEIDFKGLDTINGTGHAIIGGRYRGGQQELGLSTYYLYTGGLVAYNTSNADAKMVKNQRQQCSLKNGVFTDCDGGVTTFTLSSFTTTANLQIFAMRDVYSSAYSDYASVVLYSLKLYDGITLVRDFVPCYRIADGVIGMYDLVNDVFYTNSGTGTFTKGADVFIMSELKNAYIGIPFPESIVLDKSSISLTTIGQTEQLTATIEPEVSDKTITWTTSDFTIATVSSTGLVTCVTPGECTITATTVNGLTASCSVWQGRLPAEYQEVEYIQSSGTQYMTTSIIPSDTKGIYIKLSSQDVNNDLIYVGSRNSTDTRYRIGNSGHSLYIGWNTNDFYNNISTNTIYEVKLNYLNSRKKECNGTTVSSSIGTLSSSNTCPIGIFAGNERGSIITPSKIKLYFCKISDGSNIVYDFVPCYRKLDGVIGLYETVNKVFYTNSGTGTFTKGPDVS